MTIEGYGSDQGFTDYCTAKGYTVPSGTVSAARLRGSQGLDAAYSQWWPGTQASMSQLLAWPRTDAAYVDGTPISDVPVQVEYASYEYAIQELKSPGSTSPIVTPGKVKTRSRVEGAVDVWYGGRTGQSQVPTDQLVAAMIPVNTTVDGLLWPIIGMRSPVFGVAVV